MSWFYRYQPEEEGKWKLALAEERERNNAAGKAVLSTVLDCDNSFEKELSPDELTRVRYRGPFYIDLDSKDLEKVIEQFKKLLKNLVSKYEVELDQIHMYATGGKGFHILIPQTAFFSGKFPTAGLPYLPLIYKEMANELYVDTLDLNIYSMRKGRMLREPNIKRTNGRYKVRITPDEAVNMTVELYEQLTSAPRPTLSTVLGKCDYSSELAILFAKAQGTMEQAMKKRKTAKNDGKVLQSFGGKVPPSIMKVMSGEGIAEDVGFQKIAMQLAITAHAMMMTEEKFIESCQGLIENHKSDSFRYSTVDRRVNELRRMFAYMNENPAYTFSIGGIKSMLKEEEKVLAKDLDLGGEVSEAVSDEDHATDLELGRAAHGVKVTREGIYRKNQEGEMELASLLGLDNPRQMVDLSSREVLGYWVDLYLDGKMVKSRFLKMEAFTSRSQFVKFTLSSSSASVNLMDSQIGAIADIMRVRAEKTNSVVYTVRREGLDVVTTPDGEIDVVWADQFGVESNSGGTYRVTGSFTDELSFRTDLRNATPLLDTAENREFFKNLFNVNRADIVASMLGWYTAAFFNQVIRKQFNQFPFLHLYGQAGAGKSQTNALFAQMHYFKQTPHRASAMTITKFVMEELATCSASIPFVLEEFKPVEMRKDILDKAMGLIRSNYNGDQVLKGSLDRVSGGGGMVTQKPNNVSPMVVVSESMLTQTAIQERCVPVSLSKDTRSGKHDEFAYCQQHREVLSFYGRLLIDAARGVNFDKVSEQVRSDINRIRSILGDKADQSERQVFNIAVVLTGLEFSRLVMRKVFGDAFDAEYERLDEAVVSNIKAGKAVVKVKSEAAKFLSTLAFLSHYDNSPATHLLQGQDYVVTDQTVQIALQPIWAKYRMHMRGTGETSLYASLEGLRAGLEHYGGCVDTTCADSLLHERHKDVIAISREYLKEDQVEEFKWISAK